MEKRMTRNVILLCIFGVALNLTLNYLMGVIGLPLYVDCVGSVVVAALGGILPGMVVGFTSNLINSISDPINQYYCVISAAFALVAGYASKKGWFKRVRSMIGLWAIIVCIGGGLGSILTWYLYGGVVSGNSRTIALNLTHIGFPPFAAQFTGDIIIDMIDKCLSLTIAFFMLEMYPKKLKGAFPYSYMYDSTPEEIRNIQRINRNRYTTRSVQEKLVVSFAFFAFVICILSDVFFVHLLGKEGKQVDTLFLLKIISAEFGVIILMVTYAAQVTQMRVVSPLDHIIDLLINFENADKLSWLTNKDWVGRKKVNTGDELEILYDKVCDNQKNIINSMIQIRAASEDKAEFLSRIAYDIRTPLKNINGMLDVINRNRDDYDKVCEMLDKIDVSTSYLETMVNSVLEMNRIENNPGDMREASFDLAKIIDDCTDYFENYTKTTDIRLISHKEQELKYRYFLGDPQRIRQIILNVVSNAIKFNRPGGTVEIELKQGEEKYRTVENEIVIRDTGIGMSEEFLEHLYEPFAKENPSVKNEFTGPGLGLCAVKKMVDAMHGQIKCMSVKELGTTFTIRFILKCDEDAQNNTSEDNGKMIKNYLAGINVLMVEDSEINAEITMSMLKDAGAFVKHVENGQEALEVFIKSPVDAYDVILMDLIMPIMDGFDATRAIRSLDRNDAKYIPIIAMTASTLEEDFSKSKAAGMTDYLTKPLEYERLINTIKQSISLI